MFRPSYTSILLLGVLSGCAATPVPQPPGELPPLELGELRAAESAGIVSWPTTQERVISFSAEAGAVAPDALVRATNLSAADDAVVTSVNADGSFVVPVPLSPGDELRFEVLVGERVSAPTDVAWVGGALSPARRLDCLPVPNRVELGAEKTLVLLQNGCGGPVRIAAPSLRAPSTAVAAQLAPVTLAPGEAVSLELARVAQGAGEGEPVVLLQLEQAGERFLAAVSITLR